MGASPTPEPPQHRGGDGAASAEFSSLPPAVQVQIAGLGPLLFGAVCGFVLSHSAAGWWGLQALAALGGFAAGLDHAGARPGAVRGLVGGGLFGLGIVAADAISAAPPLAEVPHPIGLLIVVTAVAGTLLGALGGLVRRRAARA